MTAKEAVGILRKLAINSDDETFSEAVGELLDHIARMEQFTTLVLGAVRSAERALPQMAVMPKIED
jgi:hypothetical protein